jgi:predicted RND superfamily exporter protein
VRDRLEQLNRFFAALPARLRRRRVVVWCAAIVLTLVMGAGLDRLQVDMTMESFFVANDPVRLLHERFKETFGSDEGVYIVYEARDGDIFSPASLEAVRGLQQELLAVRQDDALRKPLQHILDVTTIVNASYLEVRGDTLVSRDFVEQIPRTAEDREELRGQALAHKDYPGFYLSGDSRYGGIWIRTDLGVVPEGAGDDEPDDMTWESDLEALFSDEAPAAPVRTRLTTMEEYAEFVGALDEVTGKKEYTRAIKLYAVGNPVVMRFFSDVLVREVEGFLAVALIVMMVVLGVLFRSVSGVIWPVAIVALSSILTLGLLGWLGVKLSLMVSVLVILILVVGIADAVHILSGYLYYRREGSGHSRALEQVFCKSGLACLLTSITTALGMIALVFVPIPPIRNFGFAAAVGVLLAFALTVLLLPLMLDLWAPLRHQRVEEAAAAPPRMPRVQRLLHRFAPLAQRWPVPVVVIFAVVGVVGAYGVSRVHVNSNLVELIRRGLPIRTAHDLVDQVMGGTQGMEIYLDFGKVDALKDPRVLNAMEEVQRLLEERHPEFVVRTDSLTNAVKTSFQALNEDREEMYRIPQERPALAQTLLLFDLANPEDRELLVPDDYSKGRISVRLLNYGSAEYLEFFRAVQGQMDEIFAPLRAEYPALEVGITGSLALIMRMADYVGRAQIQSFALVLIVVTVVLLVVFGSLKVGLMAMVPNVYPVLITFGVMGLWGIPLDADTLIIAPVLIGIAVDDTIHFITHYRAFVLETGDIQRAIVATLEEVGQAISFTSVILVFGFLVLIVSNHQGMANLGFLIGVAFATALLADLLLLPSLLTLFRTRFAK